MLAAAASRVFSLIRENALPFIHKSQMKLRVEIDVSQLLLETVRSRPIFDAESESVHHLTLRYVV